MNFLKSIIKFFSPYLTFFVFLALLLIVPQKLSSSEKRLLKSIWIEEPIIQTLPENVTIQETPVIEPASIVTQTVDDKDDFYDPFEHVNKIEVEMFSCPLSPFDDYKVTSSQGIRAQITEMSGGRYHNAIDYGVNVGTPVYAAKGGKVLLSSWNSIYGNYILIEHPDCTETLYAHLSKSLVKKGQDVYNFEHIAYSGNTGDTTGPHLHFEILLNIDDFLIENELPFDFF